MPEAEALYESWTICIISLWTRSKCYIFRMKYRGIKPGCHNLEWVTPDTPTARTCECKGILDEKEYITSLIFHLHLSSRSKGRINHDVHFTSKPFCHIICRFFFIHISLFYYNNELISAQVHYNSFKVHIKCASDNVQLSGKWTIYASWYMHQCMEGGTLSVILANLRNLTVLNDAVSQRPTIDTSSLFHTSSIPNKNNIWN